MHAAERPPSPPARTSHPIRGASPAQFALERWARREAPARPSGLKNHRGTPGLLLADENESAGQIVATAIVFIGIGTAVALIFWVAGCWGYSSTAQGASMKG